MNRRGSINEKIRADLISSPERALTSYTTAWPAIQYLVEEGFPPPVHEKWRSHTSFHAIKDMVANGDGIWAVTSGGVIWVVMEGPVARVIGYRSEHGLRGNEYGGIIIDKFGRPWCYSHLKGAAYFHLNRWHSFTIADELPSNCVLSAALGPDNILWLGTDNGMGFIEFDSHMKPHWYPYDLSAANIPGEIIQALAINSEGGVALGTPWGLYIQDVKGSGWSRITKKDGLPAMDIVSLINKEQGHLWVGTQDGLALYHNGMCEPFPEIQGRITKIIKTPSIEEFWFIASSDVWRYQNGRLETIGSPSSKPSAPKITAIAAHRNVGEFMGTDIGLIRRAPYRVLLQLDAASIPQEPITAVGIDKHGSVWAGSNSGLRVYHGDSWRSCSPFNSQAPSVQRISQITADIKGDIWVGTNDSRQKGGLYYAKYYHSIKPIVGDAVPQTVDVIFPASDGSLYIASGSTIKQYVNSQWINQFDSPDSSSLIRSLVIYDGELYCGCSSGLYRRQEDSWRKVLSDSVNSLVKGPDTSIWVGTTNGLFRIKDNETTRQAKKLISQKFNTLLFVGECDLWLGTARGLARINMATTSSDIEAWDIETSGLPNDTVYSIVHDSKRCCLWVGTGGGVAQYFLNDLL